MQMTKPIIVSTVDDTVKVLDKILEERKFYNKKSLLSILAANDYELTDVNMLERAIQRMRVKGIISFNKESRLWTRLTPTPTTPVDNPSLTDQEKILIDSIHKTAVKIARTTVGAVIQNELSDTVLETTKKIVFEEFRTEIKPALRQNIHDRVVQEVTEQLTEIIEPIRKRLKSLESKMELISKVFHQAFPLK